MLRKKIVRIKLIFVPCKENNYRPYLLKSNFLFYYFLFLFILRIVILPLYIYFPKNIFFAEVVAPALINLTNEERESLGLSPLIENPQLRKAALLKAQDMLDHDYFSHKSPEGVSGWDWIKKTEYNYQRAGENLAIGFLDSEEVHQAWDDSPLHQENILNPNFQDIGVAVLKGEFQGKEITVAVQFFGSPKIIESIREEIVLPVEAAELETSEKEEELEKEEEMVEGAEQSPIFKEEETKRENRAFQFNFFEFMTIKYNQIIEKIVFYSLVLITVVLIFEALVFINLSFQKEGGLKIYKGSILRSFLFIGLFILLIFFNKQVALYLIPHTLRIYGI